MASEPTIGILEEFRIEFTDFWQKLPNKGFFFALFGAWCLLFAFLGNSTMGYVRTPSLFGWMYDAYNPSVPTPESDDGHGNLIPFVVLGLFWWKRKELLGCGLKLWSPGLLLVAAGLLFHVLGFAIQQPRLSVVGLFTGIYGLMGLAWGPGWLAASFFPFCLFVFAIPLGSLMQPITFPLRLLVCRMVEVVSHVVSIDIIREGTALRDPSNQYQYEVAAACSGIRSLIATIAVSVIYAFVSFKSWWRRGVLIASAVPWAVLGNFVRMMLIVVAAEIWGQKGGNYVHDGGPGGLLSLLPYVPAFAGLMWLGGVLRERVAKPAATEKLQPQPA